MTSIRWWGHNADVMTAARAMDRLFDQFLGPGQGSTQEDGTPTYTLPVDILEKEDAYVLFAASTALVVGAAYGHLEWAAYRRLRRRLDPRRPALAELPPARAA